MVNRQSLPARVPHTPVLRVGLLTFQPVAQAFECVAHVARSLQTTYN
jgi:hypothetical protein